MSTEILPKSFETTSMLSFEIVVSPNAGVNKESHPDG